MKLLSKIAFFIIILLPQIIQPGMPDLIDRIQQFMENPFAVIQELKDEQYENNLLAKISKRNDLLNKSYDDIKKCFEQKTSCDKTITNYHQRQYDVLKRGIKQFTIQNIFDISFHVDKAKLLTEIKNTNKMITETLATRKNNEQEELPISQFVIDSNVIKLISLKTCNKETDNKKRDYCKELSSWIEKTLYQDEHIN